MFHPEAAHQSRFFLAANDGDRYYSRRQSQLDTGGSGATSCTRDQNGLTRLEVRPVVQPEPCGAVVDRDRRRLGWRQRTGRRCDGYDPAPAVLLFGLPFGYCRATGMRGRLLADHGDNPGNLAAGRVQQQQNLILAPTRQHVRKGKTDCGSVDQDLPGAGRWFVVFFEPKDLERLAEFVGTPDTHAGDRSRGRAY